MAKIHWSEWLGIIPFVILVILMIIIWFITHFNKIIAYLIIITILLIIYFLTYIIGPHLFEFSENRLKNDEKLLTLEMSHSSLLWASISGVGIAFLIPGMKEISDNPTMAIIGLILLIIGNLIYEIYYFPTYALLVRKRKIELTLKK